MTTPRLVSLVSRKAVQLVLGPFLLLSITASGADDAKPYTLFMGVDFAVQKDKGFYRVRDVNGGDFVIKVDEREVYVPMHKGAGTLKIDQVFKLTAVSAQIDGLKAERAYTPANDPYRKFDSRASAGQGAEAQLSLNSASMHQASHAAGVAAAAADRAATQGSVGAGDAAANAAAASAQADAAVAAYGGSAYDMSKQDFNRAGAAAFELQLAIDAQNFDAMRYGFTLSSAAALNRPYLVFIVHYHEKDAKPGTGTGTVVYARAIEPLLAGEKRAINILQTGMPVGFVVDDSQVRLYNNGTEVATNVSPRRMQMSKDEAFLYLKLDRVGRAKGAKLPAAPAIGRLDQETWAKLSLDQQKGPYFVQVSKDGRAEGVFLDADCTKPADETIARLARDMRFYPALENGKEQAGVAKLVLSQVPI